MNDLENLELLFSDNEKDIYKALLDKKDWINTKLILEGNTNYFIDEKGIKHYLFLECLFDNVVLFEPVIYKNDNITNKQLEVINDNLSSYKRCIFKNRIDLNSNASFYVEYDFNKLDTLGYKTLVANFYNMHNEKDMDIKVDGDSISPIDLIKISIIGNESDKCIVLNDESLINGVFFLPIVSKIYIAKPIEKDLFDELNIFCKENNVIMEVIYEDSKD